MKHISYSKSTRRIVSVLRCLSQKNTGTSGAEIARQVGIHRTTAYRLMSAMLEEGLLEQNESTKKYTIGLVLYVLGNQYLGTTNIAEAANTVIKKLNQLTGDAVSIGILNQSNVIMIMKEESTGIFRLSTHIGSTFPAHASSLGRAMLSELNEAELDNLYPEEELPKITQNTITLKKELKRELEQVRKTGVAFDNEGIYKGAFAIASPIRGRTGEITAAMNFTSPSSSMSTTKREMYAELIRLGATLVSYRLGYKHANNAINDVQDIETWWRNTNSVPTE